MLYNKILTLLAIFCIKNYYYYMIKSTVRLCQRIKNRRRQNSFDVYHMKCNSTKKRTVYEVSAIQKRWSSSKKPVFRKKLNKKIKTDFPGKSTFFELPITQKRFIFEESYISNGKRQKSCTLIVI